MKLSTTLLTAPLIGAVSCLAAAAVCAAQEPALPQTRLAASDPSTWKRVPDQAVTPTEGLVLGEAGLFKPAIDRNILYLLKSFSNDHMLFPFRQRAGWKNPPAAREQIPFWDTQLRGSSAGRFLMGAGNSLRWIEHAELRQRLDALIDGIEECREDNGYILAYPPNGPRSEEPNYARAWFTHGLLEAALAGNPKALPLLRGHANWFNQWHEMHPKLIYWTNNSHQGHIASTRTYLSPIGKPEDLQVAEKFYVMDWWLDALAARKPEAVWKYPLQNPHSYLITSFEAYLDHYRATGDQRFLDASLGAWDMIHDLWEHVGGSIAICETQWTTIDGKGHLRSIGHPPQSYYLTNRGHTGETCGSVFWIKFNQRLQQLFPEQEKYAAEIEKSIYNVILANQGRGGEIRYHSRMEGQREKPGRPRNTCCEGQGTRALGSLPEYIFSTAADGLYVNLFEPATFQWKHQGQPMTVKMISKFPFEPNVSLGVHTEKPMQAVLHIRIPGWAAASMPILVNGKEVGVGKPGTYQAIDREWNDGDTVSFSLPMDFRVSEYAGADVIKGCRRYAVEYGPILLAAVGPVDRHGMIRLAHDPKEIHQWLKPIDKRPLSFEVEGDPAHQFMPYWQIQAETFFVYPVLGDTSAHTTTRPQKPFGSRPAFVGLVPEPSNFSMLLSSNSMFCMANRSGETKRCVKSAAVR